MSTKALAPLLTTVLSLAGQVDEMPTEAAEGRERHARSSWRAVLAVESRPAGCRGVTLRTLRGSR